MTGMAEKVAATARLSLRRGTAEGEVRFDHYEVPFEPGMSVLDAILWVRTHVDASIAFRYSCINANACKECMVLVDGRAAYACTARLKAEGVTVEPLGNKRLIRDLVTDIVPPKETLRHALSASGKHRER